MASHHLILSQVTIDLYKMHQQSLPAGSVKVVLEIFLAVASHAHELNSEAVLQLKLQRACSILDISDPPIVHFENESYQSYLDFLHELLVDNMSLSEEMRIEAELVGVCEKIIQIYLDCAKSEPVQQKPGNKPVTVRWILAVGAGKKEELGVRTQLVVSALRVLGGLGKDCFRRHVSKVFPLLVELIRSEHSSGEIQRVLSNMFQSCIGPIIMQL